MTKKSDYLETRRKEQIEVLYKEYIPTFETAQKLGFNMPRRTDKKIKKIVVKQLYKDVKKINRAIRRDKWNALTPRQRGIKITLWISIPFVILILLFLPLFFL